MFNLVHLIADRAHHQHSDQGQRPYQETTLTQLSQHLRTTQGTLVENGCPRKGGVVSPTSKTGLGPRPRWLCSSH